MKTIAPLLIALLLCATALQAQDTLRVMHYNLLQYGSTQQFCDVSCKEGHLRSLVAEARPNIFVVNEMTNNSIYAQRILNNVFNTNGVTSWKRAAYVNSNNSNVVSMLYYDGNLLALKSQDSVTTTLRDILVYDLYYLSPDLALGDTVFIRVISAHLKAGSTTSDQTTRTAMAQSLMTWLETNNTIDNTLLTGDLNLGTSSEGAYQLFVAYATPSLRFHDPLNTPGSWGSSSSFAAVHTQSTRINSENDGGSGGGLDDRFDFILTSTAMQAPTATLRYVPGTYTAMGNDGNNYDKAITSSTALTSSLRTSLYFCSDHLPVYADFALTATPVGSPEAFSTRNSLRLLGNPVRTQLRFAPPTAGIRCVNILDVTGRVVLSADNELNSGTVQVEALTPGVYWVQVTDALGVTVGARFIKN